MANSSVNNSFYYAFISFCLQLIAVFNCSSQSLNWTVKLNTTQLTEDVHASDYNNFYLVQRNFTSPYDRLGICMVRNNAVEIDRFFTRDFYRRDRNTEIYNPTREDKDQNLILTGVFHGYLGFDSEDSLNIDSSHVDVLFLSKYNKEGKYQWSRILHPVSSEKFPAIILDSSNYYLSARPKTLKLDLNGDTIWSNPHYGPISLHKNRLFILKGLNPKESYEVGEVGTSYDTLRLSKIDTSGIEIWSKELICGTDHANDPYVPNIRAKIFVSESNVYIYGKYWWSFDFNPSKDESFILSNHDFTDNTHVPVPKFANFIAVYDTSGKFLRVRGRLEADDFFFPIIDKKIHVLGIEPGNVILYDENLETIGTQSLGQAPKHWWYYFVDYNQSLFISGLFRYKAEFKLLDQSYIVSADYEDTYVANYSIDFLKMEIIDNELVEYPKIYPNPVRDVLSISHTLGKSKILLFNLSGKLLLYKTIYDEGILDCTDLNGGIYILRVLNNSSQYSYKVMKL